jgi:hypothetical protein
VTATAAPGIAVIFRSLRHSRGSATESGSGRRDQGEIKTGIEKADIKKASFWPAASFPSNWCPGRAKLHPGFRSYFFFDFLAFFAFFAFFAFLAIASSFELMD